MLPDEREREKKIRYLATFIAPGATGDEWGDE